MLFPSLLTGESTLRKFGDSKLPITSCFQLRAQVHFRISVWLQFQQRFGPFPLPVTSAIALRRRFGAFSLPVTSAVALRQRFGPFPLPVTSAVTLRRRFGPFPSPVPPALPLRQRFGPFPLPVTSGFTSAATLRAFSVARHLRLYLSGDVSGHFRCPSPSP